MRGKKGFTLIELMVVILIIAVLAAVLVPMMRARLDAAKWSEARSAMGNIASGIRAYWAEHQDQAGTTAWQNPTISDVCQLSARNGGTATVGDLDGKYFTEECYTLGTITATQESIAFSVICTAANSLRTTTRPTNIVSLTLTVNANGTSAWSET